ncbi:uncharacterized protein MONBRDRAFT_28411 [Monosiga brevicollis MX1]|uniref:Protein kinase domain-containing protein n=1 Tax=Monosiga brevicollis TaxID=81824 RepID=A9V836_MONBE|nr:uncharacterized protein MONBRDRAFT_28411 [Monosiga brevicollis MX1]EDQ86200.1 predicted protein [Monosiga brevicollis MX1]|eukprot:XP_001748870.1 hypothetical protein [Monosiga brevicollis MX1]
MTLLRSIYWPAFICLVLLDCKPRCPAIICFTSETTTKLNCSPFRATSTSRLATPAAQCCPDRGVEAWLKPLLPKHATTHPFPHLDAFVDGAIRHNAGVRASATSIKEIINAAPVDLPHMDWTAFRDTATKALSALDQVFKVPEALSARTSQLDLKTTTLATELKAMHDLVSQPNLAPVLHALCAAVTQFPRLSASSPPAPKNPPVNLPAAIDKLVRLQNVGPARSRLLTASNKQIEVLIQAFVDALDAVAQAGIKDTSSRVQRLQQQVKRQPVDRVSTPQSLPSDWKKLCHAHTKLSQFDQNGLDAVAQWQASPDVKHHAWYLAFVHHEAESLVQQLQDMIDWQAQTLSVLTQCKELAARLSQSVDDPAASAHEELAQLNERIRRTMTALNYLPDDMRSGPEQQLREMKAKQATLQRQLQGQSHVDHMVRLAQLLHQHFPALLVFLHPEQSTLGARLRTVLGPDLPASLILEALTEVDRTLSLSSLGQLDLHYNQNHKVYKARAALLNSGEQDLAVKEYAFALQHKQDQCRTFLRELRAMRRLEHPHIIPVLGALVDVHSGHPSAYLVQPWCAQGDLQQWLSKARHLATSTVIAGLMTQLRTALAFMHSKGLVHRDVKLSNVMLDGLEDQPVVRLGDFDIAKAVAEATMLPCTATKASGTEGYVAPEVLFGRGRVGARPAQDAFIFGCVLYNTYMYPQTVPPAQTRSDEVVDQCSWSIRAGDGICSFPHLAAEMCDSTSELHKETRALLATDPKQRPSLFTAGQLAARPVAGPIGPAIDVLRDAPELIPEVAELLQQLSTDGRGPAHLRVQRVKRVENPVLWERYSAKRQEMLHRITNQKHYDELQTAKVDALSGLPALLRDRSCQERLLLHGIRPDRSLRDKIVRLGLDYRFAGSGAGHRFGLGVYQTDHPGKSHQYAKPPNANNERMLIITRALLGHAFVHHSPDSKALAPPLLPHAPNNERYDSVIATPAGEFHEVVMFDNDQVYPELVVYYTAA